MYTRELADTQTREKKEDASTVSLSQRANHIYPVTSAAHSYLLIFLFFLFVLFKNYQMCNEVTRYTFEEKKKGKHFPVLLFFPHRSLLSFRFIGSYSVYDEELIPRSYINALSLLFLSSVSIALNCIPTLEHQSVLVREREKKRKRCIMNDDSQLGNYAHNDLNEGKG